MADRDKVFDALRNCITEPKCRDCPWEECERFDCKKANVPVNLLLDVLNLLKEQEPRVLTLDEAAADQEVWTEVKLRGTERIPLFISILWLTDDAKDFELELIGTSRRAFQLAKEYGKTWRCWSTKPTDEHRKEVKWE